MQTDDLWTQANSLEFGGTELTSETQAIARYRIIIKRQLRKAGLKDLFDQDETPTDCLVSEYQTYKALVEHIWLTKGKALLVR